MRDLDPAHYAEADRRPVDPPIEVESAATGSARATLDYRVERNEWFGPSTQPERPTCVDHSY
jgi:hypothetical protein